MSSAVSVVNIDECVGWMWGRVASTWRMWMGLSKAHRGQEDVVQWTNHRQRQRKYEWRGIKRKHESAGFTPPCRRSRRQSRSRCCR